MVTILKRLQTWGAVSVLVTLRGLLMGSGLPIQAVEVVAWPRPRKRLLDLFFSDSTIYIVDSSGNSDAIPFEETAGLSS